MLSRSNSLWTFAGLGMVVGIATGFAVPLATSYSANSFFKATRVEKAAVSVLEIQPVPEPVSHYDVDRDAEVEKLAARNRRLVALLATLKHRQVNPSKTRPVAEREPELRSELMLGQE